MSHSVACIDYRDGKVLIAKRKNKGDMGGRWEFPGGKLKQGEDFTAAIHREMKEEFGCDSQVFEKLAESTFIHKDKQCYVTAFRVRLDNDGIKKPFTLTEHTQTKWIDIKQIETLNFVDSDLKMYKEIKKALG